jgi:hypothetical protein
MAPPSTPLSPHRVLTRPLPPPPSICCLSTGKTGKTGKPYWFLLCAIFMSTLTHLVNMIKTMKDMQSTTISVSNDNLVPLQINSSTMIKNRTGSNTLRSVPDDFVSQNENINQARRDRYEYHSPEHRTLDEVVANSSVICGSFNNSFASYWALPVSQRSRLYEDKLIYEKFFQHITDFSDMRNFHYVELGAFDGRKESNTRFYDVCLGWTGLLIEPNPRIYPYLVRNRPFAHRMRYAASCTETDETMDATVVKFYASSFTNAVEDRSPNRDVYAMSDFATDVPCGSLHRC